MGLRWAHNKHDFQNTGHTEYNVYVYSGGLTELVRIAYIRNQQSKWAFMYVWSRIDWAQKDLGIVCSRKYT